MSRLKITTAFAILAGAASSLLPSAWVPGLFGAAIGATLLFAIAARSDTRPRDPVDPAVDLALSIVNLPPDPLARVPVEWPLCCFAAAATYTLSLGLSLVLWGAYA